MSNPSTFSAAHPTTYAELRNNGYCVQENCCAGVTYETLYTVGHDPRALLSINVKSGVGYLGDKFFTSDAKAILYMLRNADQDVVIHDRIRELVCSIPDFADINLYLETFVGKGSNEGMPMGISGRDSIENYVMNNVIRSGSKLICMKSR